MLVTPVTGAYGYAMANNYNGIPRPPVIFCKDGEARVVVRRETYEDLVGAAMSDDTFRIGLLGHGTVGGAFAELLAERAGRDRPVTGMRPEIVGVLTRSRGRLRARSSSRSDLIVELMGGLEPARDYVLRAMRAGKHVVTANKQLLAHHGEELWATRARARRAAALRGRRGGRRPGHPRDPGVAGRLARRAHPRDRQRDDELHPLRDGRAAGLSYEDALAEAQRLGYAEADPTDDVTGKRRRRQDGDPRAAGVRHAGLTSTRSATRASSTSPPATWPSRASCGLGLKLIGTAERVDGGLSVRVHPAFLYAGHPLASVHGPYNAVTVESPAITEITMSGPGAGGPQTATAVLGDVISAMIPPASTPETTADERRSSRTSSSAFYVRMEVADRPGVLAQIAEVLGLQGASIKTLVQHGLGDDARLVMTVHPILESQACSPRCG